MLSPIRTSAKTGDDNNQLSQPNSNIQRKKENWKIQESQRCYLSLTTMKQRCSETTEQPANKLCP